METRLKSDTRATELRRRRRPATRRLERTAFVLLTLCLAADAVGQTSSARLFITPLQVQPLRALAPRVLREGRVRLDDSLLGSAAAPPASQIALRLFADVAYTATLRRTAPTASGRSWVGTLDDVALSTAAFVRVGRTVAGFISSPLGTYQLLTDDSGVSVVQEIADDPRSGPTPDDSVEAPAGPAPDTRLGTRSGFRPMATAFESTVDVLVVYTPGALAAAGNLERLTADLELGAALADSAFRNAGTGGLRVVHVALGQSEEAADTAQALLRLWARTDGFLDEVHALRERYAADSHHTRHGQRRHGTLRSRLQHGAGRG